MRTYFPKQGDIEPRWFIIDAEGQVLGRLSTTIANIISIGAAVGIIVVVLVLLLGQARVAFAMARDGLLPPVFAKVHPKFRTPYVITATVGVLVAVLATFTSIDVLAELVNVGTLFAFILVSIGVVVLRRTRPDLPRSFRTPGLTVVASLSVLMCLYLMLNLTGGTWVRFLVWMAIGLVVYFAYGRHHSRLWQEEPSERAPDNV